MAKTGIFLTDEEMALANAVLSSYQIKLLDQLLAISDSTDYRRQGIETTLTKLSGILTEVRAHESSHRIP